MKEFIEKLIGRLEEHCGIKREICDCDGVCSECDFRASIEIVKELAEEYKECDLCYFANPCEYQNKDAKLPLSEFADDNGWIPCSSDQKPKEGKFYNVTIFDGEDYRTEPAYYARIGYLGQRDKKAQWWTDCTNYAQLIEEDDDKVIAWQPLPEPCIENERG